MPVIVNPAARVAVQHVGAEAQPIVIVDDVLAAPRSWIEQASRLMFAGIGEHYPGVRARVPDDAAWTLVSELGGVVAATFDRAPPLLECYLSIVTTPPSELAPIQRLPHIDGVERDRIAILIFLGGTAGSGTAFFRHRATGYESIDASRLASYRRALADGIAEHGLPEADYIDGDTALFERIAWIEARPNRALIYRSHALHCAAISPDATFSADPARGRLTINAFLCGGPA